MRDLEREGAEKDTTAISIQCHPSVADVLLEDKRDVLEDLEHQFNKKITIRGNGAYHVEQYELVAHRDSKNMVWSSEERRQLVRQRAQERAQRLVAEQRKKESDERERRRKEQEEARQKVAAEREERRKVLESLLEKRRQQIDALRTLRKQEAEERRAAAIASGQDPETLIVEEIIVTEAELEPLIGPDGQPITLLQLEQQLGGGRGGGADRQDRNRRRRRRGRRGKPGPRAGHHAGGRHREPHHRGQPAQTAGAEGPSSDEGAYNAPSNVDQEHYSSEDLAGSVGGGDDDGDYSADSDENIGNAVGSPAEPGAPRSARSGAGADSRANQNRRRRGRRGGRRHRFRRRPPGGAAGAGQGTSSEGGGPSDGPTPVNVSGSDNKGGGFSDPQE